MGLKYTLIKWISLVKGQKAETPPAGFSPENSFLFPDFSLQQLNGATLRTGNFRGKRILIVNVASKCGFTPQYAELEKLYAINKDKLIIIGIPSDEFGNQEFSSNDQIAGFCESNYGITFPITQKARVKTDPKCELYTWLTDPVKNGWNSKAPTWNFCKYLIDEKGFLVGYYPSALLPEM